MCSIEFIIHNLVEEIVNWNMQAEKQQELYMEPIKIKCKKLKLNIQDSISSMYFDHLNGKDTFKAREVLYNRNLPILEV
jgi:hypothetical protein